MSLRAIGLCRFTTALFGCSLIPKTPSSEAGSLMGDIYLEELSRGYFERSSPGEPSGIELFRDEYRKLLAKGDDASVTQALILRSDVVYDLLSISDALYQDFKDNLFAGRANFDSFVDVLNLLLTGVAAALNSSNVDAKTSLAAAATFLQGTKQSVDKNFFASQTLSALIVSMDGERARIRANLITQLSQASPSEFTLGRAIVEVQQYHRAGSIINAIVQISQATGEQSNANQKQLKEAERAQE